MPTANEMNEATAFCDDTFCDKQVAATKRTKGPLDQIEDATVIKNILKNENSHLRL